MSRAAWTDLTDDQLLAQCEVDTYRASGPGGQKRNKTSSAVRLRHPPSGLLVIAEESRSQHENKARALKRLRQALYLKLREPIPQAERPKVYTPHPVMDADEIRRRTQGVWDEFYSLPRIWRRSRAVRSLKARIAFLLISKLYRQMYANTGIATDSARHERSVKVARLTAKACRRFFTAAPMRHLEVPPAAAPASSLESRTA